MAAGWKEISKLGDMKTIFITFKRKFNTADMRKN